MAINLLGSLVSILVALVFAQSKASLQHSQEFHRSVKLIISAGNSDLLSSSTLETFDLPTSPLVPAFFVIGDSSVDCGTNNFLGTFARADRLPYGRDFDSHTPTGRFCNGRIPVDYLALRLGLPFVPSYLGQTGTVEGMIHGVNYASAGAGVIFTSGSELGQHISFTQQIQQFMDTTQRFVMSMGEDSAAELISNSVIYISIGINDYIHYYLRNVSDVQSLYLPWNFNQFLAATIIREIKNLFNMNVRKVVVMGLAPIGCAPHYLWEFKSKNGECVEEINDLVMEFNFVMRYLIEKLYRELPNTTIIFCDVLQGSMDILQNHKLYGFDETTGACCGLGEYNGWIMCMSSEMACKDASKYIWWDQFHPTDAVNAIVADNVWNGLHTKMCYPMPLKDMRFGFLEQPPSMTSAPSGSRPSTPRYSLLFMLLVLTLQLWFNVAGT